MSLLKRIFRARLISSALSCCLVSLSLGINGCSQSTDLERESWLLRTLVDDHFHLISRESGLVGGKFRKMLGGGHGEGEARSLYPYFRGTLSQMYRDLSGDYTLVVPTVYSSPESALVFMVGDPHLENVSAMIGEGGVLRLEWDDFDSAGYGPWIWDVRRLALSFWVFAYDLGRLELATPLVEAVIRGYLRGTSLWRDQLRVQPSEGQRLPSVIRALFAEAREKLNEGRLWTRYTETQRDGSQRIQRYLKRGTIRKSEQVGVIRDALLSLNDREVLIIEEIERSLTAQGINVGHLKDYARRYGQGVSSYPLMRFYMLFEGPTEALEDDQIWEVKELGDRPVPSGLDLKPPRQFGAQGERILRARRALQWGPIASGFGPDPTTWVDVNSASFRVRLKSDLQRGLNLEDLIKHYKNLATNESSDAALSEVTETAELLGSLLAGAHCFAPTLNGIQGGVVINRDLDLAGHDMLAPETLDFINIYGQVMRQDRIYLSNLLDRFGPTLGAQGGWNVEGR